MRLAAVLAGAGSLALAGCAPAPETPAPASASQTPAEAEAALQADDWAGVTVRGEVSWPSGVTRSDQAVIIVEVHDLDRGADAEPVGKLLTPALLGPPVEFMLPLSSKAVSEAGDLVLRARLQDDYAILLASDGDIDIADSGETAGLSIPLYNPEDLARGRSGQMITPTGARYTCGGEALIIAVEAGAAYVTFGDGASVRLDRLDGAPGAATQFSNGRFLVEQGTDEYGAPALKFGRGRAVPQACTAAG
ncbi:MAG: YbaY family lipoprotein [Hyphomonas sp.]|nr:YbaY family lipoprotein [Hyphomonas sp.]